MKLFIVIIITLALVPFSARAQYFRPESFTENLDFYFQIGDVDDDGNPDVLASGDGEVLGTIILGDRDPSLVIVNSINIILSFLGIMVLLIILSAGLKMFVYSGNQELVLGARKTLSSGVIGLIIVLSSFGIARFVIDALVNAI